MASFELLKGVHITSHGTGAVYVDIGNNGKGSDNILGRNIEIWINGRFHKWNKYVYDGRARDVKTGIEVTSKHWKSKNGARKHALQELAEKLKQTGNI